MNERTTSEQTQQADAVTTVRMDGQKYRRLRMRLLAQGKTFRDWLNERIDDELTLESREKMEVVR
jgi:hypothetical protein